MVKFTEGFQTNERQEPWWFLTARTIYVPIPKRKMRAGGVGKCPARWIMSKVAHWIKRFQLSSRSNVPTSLLLSDLVQRPRFVALSVKVSRAWTTNYEKEYSVSWFFVNLEGSSERILGILEIPRFVRPWKWEVILAERCWRTQSCCWTLTRLEEGRWSFFTRPAGASVASIGQVTREANLRRGRTNTDNLMPRWSPSWRVFWMVAALTRRPGRIASRGNRVTSARLTVNRANWIKEGIVKVDFSYPDRDWSYRFTPTPGGDEPALLRRLGDDIYAKVFRHRFFVAL